MGSTDLNENGTHEGTGKVSVHNLLQNPKNGLPLCVNLFKIPITPITHNSPKISCTNWYKGVMNNNHGIPHEWRPMGAL